ncbi:synapse-associated protein of 47 kDa-like isoform X4 [Macrosteles quadrilineatus]|uniref:synapse-associated protein of 47 kDa-like isoform X2 n=1 Tax=Macrosteles quadrilineatus TaxID=74068 RepID=UPI0023E24C7F|nr:synapse-associated protein of 47 kDa-like isoform X2 [Macrosteles quadrilineatus]XP_054270918.1 synapse-associated protein of 47 kDa-like isoform X3 [Macrosteles quadrilineatus]XP_054270919.1 synapse-associated protein of 47 kDa-like isoform X4 [Macrosteles quadrilineatus]
MFSGLSNQVSSWMGSGGKKPDEEIPNPNPEEQQPVSSSPVVDKSLGGLESDQKDSSPSKEGSRLNMLGNLGSVKNQMSSWLGSASIPSMPSMPSMPAMPAMPTMPFRKSDGTTEGSEGLDNPGASVESPASEKSVKGSPTEKEEDDNSRMARSGVFSATGGADSDAGDLGEEENLDDKDAAIGGVSTKALQGAKSIGSFLFSAVNTAGKKVTETTAKIKKTVEENSLLGEFNKEQEAFIKEKQGKGGETAVPPWVGYPNQESLKEECLALSQDKRNFIRSPPAGVDFPFDYETSYPVAMATMAEDPNLETMRYELVPKVISEENFWRNYFYRVSLICQASELNSMAQEGNTLDNRTSEPAAPAPTTAPAPPSEAKASYSPGQDTEADSPNQEFVSDNFRPSSQDLEEVREGMKKLGLDPAPVKEEEWEKELEAELQDFEVVANGDKRDAQWESQIEEMLDAEDLKSTK